MNRPALKLSIFFALGILLGRYVDFPVFILVGLSSLLFLFILIRSLQKKASGTFIYVFYVFLIITISCLHYTLRTSNFSSRHVSNFLDIRKPVELSGKIGSFPEVLEERTRFIVRVTDINLGERWHKVEGKVQVTIGERTDRFSYGDVIRFTGRLKEPQGRRNPGGFDYRAYLNRKGVYGIVFVKRSHGIDMVSHSSGNLFLSRIIWPIKGSMARIIECHLSGSPAALLKGILLGERQNVPESIEALFRDAGVIHVLVVSGLHVGLVVFIFFNLFRAFRFPFNWAVGCTLSIILLYVFVMGLRPPVVRASLMAAIILVGLTIQRNVDMFNTVAFAGLVILVGSPQSLFDPGFQLSFAAVLSITYLYPRLKAWLPRCIQQQHTWWRRWLVGGTLVSLSAQLGIAPVVVYYFYRLPTLSVLANLIVVPWVGLVLSLGFAAVVSGPLCIHIALLFNACNWLVLKGLVQAVSFFASLPVSTLYVPQPSLLFIGGYYSIVCLIVNVRRSIQARRWLMIAGLVAANLWVWGSLLCGKGHRLTVTFFDVGHGDAVFIRSPGGQTMLIDGGRRSRYVDYGERVIQPFLMRSGIRKIDAVLLTHPHSDHLGGLLTILEEFDVDRILDSGLSYQSFLYDAYMTLVENKGIPRCMVRAGDIIEGFDPLRLVVLHPTDEYATPDGWAPYGLNNGSVVLRLNYGTVSFLFLADVEHEVDRALLKRRNLLKTTIVKVPHQGSATSSSKEIIAAISPSFAIVSVAFENQFGHPAEEVVQRYAECGAVLYRTDRHGAVIVETDGEEIEMRTMVDDAHFSMQSEKCKMQNAK